MSRRIQSLSPQLASQIAAGEVVERPASVAKELLENSIDAGASRIELELEQGGLKLLRVTDNGCGIHPDDLPLALAQHATSKIYSQRELEQVTSLGFRGEALASIASVSRFSLCSVQPGQPHGWRVASDGHGGVSKPQACALEAGSRVEVRDLFYNTPARRKFMRSDRTEYLHVEETVKRLALSRFDVAFDFSHNGRRILHLRAGQDEAAQQRRIGELLGKGFIEHARRLEVAAAGMHLHGYLSPPEHSFSQSGKQYFYLNGRIIRDKLVSHAIRQGYLAVLDPGRHPAYVLYLTIEPGQIDINVHPTKHEVRFRQSRLVHDFLLRAVTDRLATEASRPGLNAPPSANPSAEAWPRAEGMATEAAVVAEPHHFYHQATPLRLAAAAPAPVDTHDRLLLHGCYLLDGRAPEPLLLDIQRLRRELWMQQLSEGVRQDGLTAVPLLVPERIELGAAGLERLLAYTKSLSRLGLGWTPLGPATVAIRQLPQLMQGIPLADLLALLLSDEPQPDEPGWQQRLIDSLLALAPPLTLLQALEIVKRWEALMASSAPWRPLSAARLQQWLGAS